MSSKTECLQTTPLVTPLSGDVGEQSSFRAYISTPDGSHTPIEMVKDHDADHQLEQCPQTGAYHLVPRDKKTPGKPAYVNSQAFHDNWVLIFGEGRPKA
jgi:hypothetical protein